MFEVQNRGSGAFGKITPGWQMNYLAAPMVIGLGGGRLGDVSFECSCDETIKFTIDNEISVKHYLDDQMTRGLSGFNGFVRGLTIDKNQASVSMVSIASALDGTQTSHANPAGVFQRLIRLPQQKPYVITSTTHYTGGFFTTVNGVQVWETRPIAIYDVTSDEDSIYVLADGAHSGEVVFHIGLDGEFRSVWPVYSDANDTSAPASRFITYAEGYVWIAQQANDRVKQFHAESGTFITQWGAAGTGNGQFTNITDIAAHPTSDHIYVVDQGGAVPRVQRFTKAGVYSLQWGSNGTGNGQFTNPNSIGIDRISSDVFVGDDKGRIQRFSSSGLYSSTPFGYYSSGVKGELRGGFSIPATPAFDSWGNAFVLQDGAVFKFGRNNATLWPDVNAPKKQYKRYIQKWFTKDAHAEHIDIHPDCGVIHIAQNFDYVEQWAGSTGNLKSYILYYIALAVADLPVCFEDFYDPWDTNELAFVPWQGNVWTMLGELCAATDNTMVAFEDRLCFVGRKGANFVLPSGTLVGAPTYDSSSSGHDVTVVNYNATRSTAGKEEVVYNAKTDRRSITVNQGEVLTFVIETDFYPEYVRDPIPVESLEEEYYSGLGPGAGTYVVTTPEFANGADLGWIYPPFWEDAGGKVTAQAGPGPNQITLKVYGPTSPLPMYSGVGPWTLKDRHGFPALSIVGRGVKTAPQTYTIGTGVDARLTGRQVATSIDSPFLFNAKFAMTEASWAAYVSSSPSETIQFIIPRDSGPKWMNDVSMNGTAMLTNCIVTYGEAQYMVTAVTGTETGIILSCHRYTKTGNDATVGDVSAPRPEEIWNGKTAAQFEAFWAEYTAQDFALAPLRYKLPDTIQPPPLSGDFWGTQTSTTNITTSGTYTFNSQPIGEPSSTRRVVVVVSGRDVAASPSAVTIGGVSATMRVSSNTTQILTIWDAVVPTGTTATITVDVTSSQSSCGIGVWSLGNCVFVNDVETSGNSGTPAMSISTESGDFVITGLAYRGSLNLGNNIAWNSANERYDEAVDSLVRQHAGADLSSGGGIVDMGSVISNYGSESAAAAVSYRRA